LLELWLEKGWLERVEAPEIRALPAARPRVLDPFCGSGTVGEVCRKLEAEGYSIDFIGVDLSGEYLSKHASLRADLRTTQAALEEAMSKVREKYQAGELKPPKGENGQLSIFEACQ
jgi:SAM-dependent methyltransferase